MSRRDLPAGLTAPSAPVAVRAAAGLSVLALGAGLAGPSAGRTRVASGHRVVGIDADERDLSQAKAGEAAKGRRVAGGAAQRLIRPSISRRVAREYGTDWREASARHVDGWVALGGGDAVFPGGHDQIPAVPSPLAPQIPRWSRDPFALGSCAFNAMVPRVNTRQAPRGKDWDGRLIFAGKAASPEHPAFAHRARMPGVQAAPPRDRA